MSIWWVIRGKLAFSPLTSAQTSQLHFCSCWTNEKQTQVLVCFAKFAHRPSLIASELVANWFEARKVPLSVSHSASSLAPESGVRTQPQPSRHSIAARWMSAFAIASASASASAQAQADTEAFTFSLVFGASKKVESWTSFGLVWLAWEWCLVVGQSRLSLRSLGWTLWSWIGRAFADG